MFTKESELIESLYVDRLNGKFEYELHYLLERHHNYKNFYCDKGARLIEKLFEDDIKAFDYRF